jgi:tetratricopeptide (TPR) repeat protein
MKHFKLWNVLLGWGVFAIAATTYLLTMEPTASFWDCGEFIASAFKLDVGHPPGAPFFMLMGRFFSLFAEDTTQVAMCVNALSALASAFTILFLFWTITALGRKLVQPNTLAKGIALLGAGAVGALAYTFSDTFWFSAVEGEVYASSSLFTAVVFWLILKWDEKADEEGSDKWLILIAYLMGLSIGVHLLNLLTIPAIVLVYYFRRHKFSWLGVLAAFGVSVAILAVILYGIIPGVPTIAGWFELLFTNVFKLPFNTGLAVYLVLLAISLLCTIGISYWSIAKDKGVGVLLVLSFVASMTLAGVPFIKESIGIGVVVILLMLVLMLVLRKKLTVRWINTISMMVAVIIIGYGSYAAIVIRSSADTPMDQNSPDNVFSLKYYLNREQYGDTPLFYGKTYGAPVKLEEKGYMCIPVQTSGKKQYAPAPKQEGVKDRYVVTGEKSSYEYMDEFKMLFPRMHSDNPDHINAYKQWADVKGKKIQYEYCGRSMKKERPTFVENIRFFLRYQVNFMYWRYFMWNFSGRQNDLQSYGEIYKGNWITGIPFIDKAMLGDQDTLPTELRENKGRNVYFMLPLLLGLIGLVWQVLKRNKEDNSPEGLRSFVITFLLFFLTGLAIVVYLNQTPYQPRERDYAYAGSFYAFSIWIGLGVLALYELCSAISKNKWVKAIVALLVVNMCLGVPALMAIQNWDDHDRSNRYVARDFGANYLESCDKDAIIFCNGDNDTFPLWYNIEVEGKRTDVRACNLSYLQTDWYIDQMKRPYYESPALPISWEYKDYMPGKNDMVTVENVYHAPLDVKTAFQFVLSEDESTKKDGDNFIPSEQLYVLSPEGDKIFIKSKSYYNRSEMMVMDMLATNEWKRPMYFAVSVGSSYHLGLDPYLELTGMAYRITPTPSANRRPRVNTEVMYDNMMNKFAYGNVNEPGVYLDENTLRMCRTHRMMFVELAKALYNEGKLAKTEKVLDYAEEMLPSYNVAYDESSISMADLYYRLGRVEKANTMIEALLTNSLEYLAWGTSLKEKHSSSVETMLKNHLLIAQYTMEILAQNKQYQVLEKYYESYIQYRGDLYTWLEGEWYMNGEYFSSNTISLDKEFLIQSGVKYPVRILSDQMLLKKVGDIYETWYMDERNEEDDRQYMIVKMLYPENASSPYVQVLSKPKAQVQQRNPMFNNRR